MNKKGMINPFKKQYSRHIYPGREPGFYSRNTQKWLGGWILLSDPHSSRTPSCAYRTYLTADNSPSASSRKRLRSNMKPKCACRREQEQHPIAGHLGRSGHIPSSSASSELSLASELRVVRSLGAVSLSQIVQHINPPYGQHIAGAFLFKSITKNYNIVNPLPICTKYQSVEKTNTNCYPISRYYLYDLPDSRLKTMIMNILISGSLAYDYIMDFPDSFKNHILPDQLHILNVCFVVQELKKNFGGTAGNIAYTMRLLGANPVVVGALGTDATDYIEWFKKNNIETKHIAVSKEKMTSSAHITTDKDDNQVTAFYPGAGGEAEDIPNSKTDESGSAISGLALISPTEKNTMVRHALQLHNASIPFCFDPGQQITALSPQELMGAIGQAKFLIGNDYEMKLIQEKTGWNETEMLNHVDIVITTLGEHGSTIVGKHGRLEIEPCTPQSVEDPTGAGDAYRAGFFWAYAHGLEIKTCGRAASVAASYAIEHYGTQNHNFTPDEFAKRYEKTYGDAITI